MKKKIIVTIISICISICIVFSVITVAYAEKIRSFDAGSKESVEYFSNKTTSQLINDMRYFSSLEDVNLDMYFALYDKISQQDAEFCSKIIESPMYSNVSKIALLDICRGKEISLDKNILGKAATKESLDSELRSYIILYCSYQENEYTDKIAEVASNFDDELSYYALWQLKSIDKQSAEKISKQAISEYDGEYSDLMRNALLIEADYINTTGNEKEINDFADYCNKLANEPNNTDNQSSISLVLSELKTGKSLKYILDLDNVNDEYKINQIKNNMDEIKEILQEPANESNCEILESVLKYYPLNELKDNLAEFKDNNSAFLADYNELSAQINKTTAME